MRENLKWLGYILQIREDRMPKIVLINRLSMAKQKADCPWLGWEDVIKKDLKELRAFWEIVKMEVLNRLGWRKSGHSYGGLRHLMLR